MAIELSFDTLANGGVVESLLTELQRALDNCLDPNTDPKATRKVKLEMKIKPNELRNMAEVETTASATLSPAKPLSTSFYIGKDLVTGKASATEIPSGENFGQHAFPGSFKKGEILNEPDGFPAKVTNLKHIKA